MKIIFIAITALLVSGCPSKVIENKSESEDSATVTLLMPDLEHKDMLGYNPEIYVDGEIDEFLLDKIKKIVIDNNLKKATIIFNSPGGNLSEALDIGEYIRDMKFSTDVGQINSKYADAYAGECYSACPFAYVGGRYRYFDKNSRMGVHRFRTEELMDDAEAETQSTSGYLIYYLKSKGIDIEFLESMYETDKSDMENLSIYELMKLNVVNNGELEAKWELIANEDGVKLDGYQDTEIGITDISMQCNDKLSIEFNVHKPGMWEKEYLKNEDAYFIIDDEKIPLQKLEIVSKKDGLFFDVVLTNNMVLKMLSSDEFGVSSESEINQYEYLIDVSTNRKLVSNFLYYCTIT